MRTICIIALAVIVLIFFVCVASCVQAGTDTESVGTDNLPTTGQGERLIEVKTESGGPKNPSICFDRQWDQNLEFAWTVFIAVEGRSWEVRGLPADVPKYYVSSQFSLWVYPAERARYTDYSRPPVKRIPRTCWLYKATVTGAGEFALGTGTEKIAGGIPAFTYLSTEDCIRMIPTDGVWVGGTNANPKEAIEYVVSQPLESGKFYALSNPVFDYAPGVPPPFCIIQVE